MTKYELEILRIVSESMNHLTTDEVFFELQKKFPSVVKATCYNNLKKLTEAGLIRKIVSEVGGDRYDRIVRHDHLVCSKCGKLKDAFLPDMSSSLKEALGESSILGYDLKIYWECPECRTQSDFSYENGIRLGV